MYSDFWVVLKTLLLSGKLHWQHFGQVFEIFGLLFLFQHLITLVASHAGSFDQSELMITDCREGN